MGCKISSSFFGGRGLDFIVPTIALPFFVSYFMARFLILF